MEKEVKVGIFVAAGVALIAIAILVLGSTENLFQSKLRYSSYFASIDGMIPGAKVVVGGVNVGTVDAIDFDSGKRMIRVDYSVAEKASEWVRRDSMTEIATQGIMGDKYLIISAGAPEQQRLPDGSEIPIKASRDLNQFIGKGDELMEKLNRVAENLDKITGSLAAADRSEQIFSGIASASKNLSSAIDGEQLRLAARNLNSILEKINNGSGTLGALINDPSLYDDMKSLMGGANRNKVVRNLVRKTIKDSEDAQAKQARETQAAGQAAPGIAKP